MNLRKNRVKWTDEKLERVAHYTILGFTAREVADKLTTEFSETYDTGTVQRAKDRRPEIRHLIEKESSDNITYYKARTLPMEDYTVMCDAHSPFHSEVMINRAIMMSAKFGIKKLIFIGDAFDFSFAKHWLSDDNYTMDQEGDLCKSFVQALSYFDKIYLCRGNHEYRVNRLTDGKIVSGVIVKALSGDTWDGKLEYSGYDRMYVGDFNGIDDPGYMMVHPKSYSQVSPAVARRLAEKFHRHIINSHGHLLGFSADRSGKFMAVDLGGMFDTNKIEYISKHTTTHPTWINGFGMLLNGKFHHFHKFTDFGYWGV